MELCHGPSGNAGVFVAIDDFDIPGIGDVHENAAAILLELERLRMAIQFDCCSHFAIGRANDAERAIAIADIN